MSFINKIGAAQKFLSDAGINMESIFDLFSGKASPQKVAQCLTPILLKASPALGAGIKHLENESGEKRYLIISIEEDEKGNPLEALSIARINPENGQMELLESIPFYMLATYIVGVIEQQKAKNTIGPETSSHRSILLESTN